VNACLAAEGNLALGKDTEDITTYRSPSSAAVDGNPLSASCTDDDHGRPWWVVDLGAPTIVERVLIVAPAVNGENRNYRRSCFIR